MRAACVINHHLFSQRLCMMRLPNWLWPFVSILCLLAALLFWWSGRADACFVAATLGVVAWFLRLRNRYRRSDIEEDAQIQNDIENGNEIDEN